uniref:FH2 domain-containing protein n=1 Tax=Odontella aurita TaxID=265563 RepID=A0A7S4MWI0_9STRA
MDLDPNKSLKSQLKKDDDAPPLKDDPDYAKYFKMLKMGLPMGAVKNALQREGKDPAVMDLDHDKSVKSQLAPAKKKKKKKEKKIKVRRKKIFWNPIDESDLGDDTLWSMVKGTVNMGQLKFDTSEFESLFTDKSDPSQKKKKDAAKGGGGGKDEKKQVQIIDGKRAMNGGIILARLKMEYSKIADMVNTMDAGDLDATQLKALKEFLPTDDENEALKAYMAKAEKSDDKKKQLLQDIQACERYMVAMMEVNNASAKFDCMLFQIEFETRMKEIVDEITIMIEACDQIRSSQRLRKLMAVILTLGNQINTGGTGNLAAGFSLDALLKLDEAKAFDKKTSVLQYLVKLIRTNDESLLKFKEDLSKSTEAEGVLIDSLLQNMKQMKEELDGVKKTAEKEAEKLREENSAALAGRKKLTLEEMKAQKTSVRKADGVSHYNRMVMDEKTPMEDFVQQADGEMKKAFDKANEMKGTYVKVLQYFGEDEKMSSGDFFGYINKFKMAFYTAHDTVAKIEAQRIKEEKRAAAKAAKEKAKEKRKKGVKGVTDKVNTQANLQMHPKTRNGGGGSEAKEDAAGPGGALHRTSIAAKADSVEVEVDGAQDGPPKGGIAAFAAAAALKKKDKVEDGKGGEGARPPLGGIAAMAAAAALKKKESEGGDSSDNGGAGLPKGGIAAMAAAAALKKKPPKGGIAAMAAAAALQKKGGEGDESGESSEGGDAGPPKGGIAAMAAAAALRKKGDDVEEEKGDSSAGAAPPMGGIAAMAAAAAQKKASAASGGGSDKNDKHRGGWRRGKGGRLVRGEEEQASPPGGIAAMAAAAAMKKQNSSNEPKEVVTDASDGPRAGGIASMAAAAALKKSQSKANMYPAAGGIAAMAAAAALKKQESHSATDTSCADAEEGGPPKGGIAAMAAAAARKTQQDEDYSEEVPSRPAGGIAAMAAAAALKKQKSLVGIGENAAPPAGGIAAMAAAAALKKSQSRGNTAPAGGGIAAMAAAAALKKQRSQTMKRAASETEEEIPPSGGIAAMAAAAARRKQISEEREEDEYGEEDSGPPFGGIAAMAAAAALKKQKSASDSNESNAPPAGSIAAMAAAAALKKQASQRKESTSAPSGGIAAMAAAAARRKKLSEENEPSKEEYGPPVGGIAAMAAAAALKKQKSMSDTEEGAAPPVGDIAAFAAAAARKKQGVANTTAEDDQPKTLRSQRRGSTDSAGSNISMKGDTGSSMNRKFGSPGSVASMAAASALKEQRRIRRQQSEDSNDATASVGVAAMAASAAMKKLKYRPQNDGAGADDIRPPTGGIAMMAAAAALKKQTSHLTPNGTNGSDLGMPRLDHAGRSIAREEKTVPQAGGIAAKAFAAARQRRSNEERGHEHANGSTSLNTSAPEGGIAALAAAAALKKQRARPQIDVPSGGGIAAMAASAAVRKQKGLSRPQKWAEDEEVSKGMNISSRTAANIANTLQDDGKVSTPKRGLSTSRVETLISEEMVRKSVNISSRTGLSDIGEDEQGTSEDRALPATILVAPYDEMPEPMTPPRGGIAAAAAANARARQALTPDGVLMHEYAPKGGIAAAAAAAALSRSNKEGDGTSKRGGSRKARAMQNLENSAYYGARFSASARNLYATADNRGGNDGKSAGGS